MNGCNKEEPLCVFCLSPPFFIRSLSGEKRRSAPSRRQEIPFSTSSFVGLRFSRFNRKKSYTNLLLAIADLFSNFKKRKSLNLEEILSTIQDVWQGPETNACRNPEIEMEKLSKKLSMQEPCPPNPQRRRLSVPETIMRKHNLAQENSCSQESKNFHWSNETQCSSDPNLSKKRDFNIIRKSTLLRRLWGDNKPKLSGSFQEWQHSYKRVSSTQSLNSNHSSPEHLPKTVREPLSPRRKLSSSPNRFSVKNACDGERTSNSPKRKIPVIGNASLKSLSKTPLSRESTTKYSYSSFTNCSDTNSDSAYTNSISNFTNAASTSSNTTKNYHNDETRSRSEAHSRLSTVSLQESGVQTRDVANLNVISNVSLSQTTLDVIFKEVMKDVSSLTPGEINISSAKVICDNKNEITVEKVPSVSLDTHSDFTRLSSERSSLEKFILSNVRTGSPYTKTMENAQPAVPRFSAVPRTSSMEVNTSEEDKEESDTASFVDSLEDFSSPRPLARSRRSSSDVSQLLPEGKKDTSPKKSSTFFIPIEIAREKEIKAVSEFLPIKVREKLIERQQKREEKCRQFKSALKTTDNVNKIKSTLNLKNYLPKKRTKPVLPSIESLKKSAKEKKVESPKASSTLKRNSRFPKVQQATDRNIHPIFDPDKRDEILVEPRKIYHRTSYENSQKRIEILEIMECIEIPPDKSQKSKIPVPISSGGYTHRKTEFDKPAYLDIDNHDTDHKLDQLIANILIDSLNHDAENANNESDKTNANFSEPSPPRSSGKYLHKFDAIPEEISAPRRSPEESNNNNDGAASKNRNEKCTRSVRNKNLEKKDRASIPKGWVTVYTVHKDTETPESTSDEGKKYLDTNNVKEATHRSAVALREKPDSEKSNVTNDNSKTEYQNDYFLSSSEDENTISDSTLLHRPLQKFGNNQRKPKMKCQDEQEKSKADWSVTVSGSNSYGQMAPDVEMRLKFPNKSVPCNQNYCDSGPEKENTQRKRFNFPKIENDNKLSQLEKKCRRRRSIDEALPKIQSSLNKNKKKEGSVISVAPSVIIPRQTKTSRSRYHLSRPRERFSLPDVPSMLNERQYYEILRRIPSILAVAGRSISSEGKSIEER